MKVIALPMPAAIFLGAVLQDDVPVGHLQSLGVATLISSCPGPHSPLEF
jgi:hypothetical protein